MGVKVDLTVEEFAAGAQKNLVLGEMTCKFILQYFFEQKFKFDHLITVR